jgi:tRNA nucleotidyltransferase (CCA-adding enzyme)
MTNRLEPPQPVVEIAERLERAGHETWCVGGAVRDALLGHPHLDWDLATSARPPQVQALFRRSVPV